MIELISDKYYTRIWADGQFKGHKCIFQYKGKSSEQDMIKVNMFCSNFQEEFHEDAEITISQEASGEHSFIKESPQEDIDFLLFVKEHWVTGQDANHIDISYDEKNILYNYNQIHSLTPRQILSFLQSGLNKSNQDNLTLFIDTIRMIRMSNDVKYKDGIDYASICVNEETLKIFHDSLVKEFEVIDNKETAKLFEEAVIQFKSFEHNQDGLKIELISSLSELNNEGAGMNHCIATYVNMFTEKKYIAFRVYYNNERLTLGCVRNENDQLTFNQLKGYGNAPASSKSCDVIVKYCEKNNINIDRNANDLRPLQYDNVKTKTLGGIAQFNGDCRTEKCVYNVSRTCKCRDINGKFCIGYTS